ncbi:hypothetical protein DPX16_18203 [Anabarilius grahami]|uniref:Uncharacterized protein n=1 Tax=Anabarilius grahami TaxID=495550 RepID=A0A3N0Y8F1_ANAGA|nr:hypothetical protein DPX16_18203 [Anabarilius grahami]
MPHGPFVTSVGLKGENEDSPSHSLAYKERHLWLNLSSIKDKDKNFLMDAPLAPPGLFGDAVNTVVDRFQEANKQAAAFQKLLPHRSFTHGAAQQHQQPQTSKASSSQHRASQKQSVSTRTPPQRSGGSGGRSQPQPSRGKTDLRNVIIAKKAAAKKS